MHPDGITAIGGFAGAMAMFAGDLFLYAHWGVPPLPDSLIYERIPGRASLLLANDTHLMISALLGGIAVLGYVLGAVYIQRRFNPNLRYWGLFAGICFGVASILGGVYHALWSSFGIALRAAISDPLTFENLLDSHEQTLAFINMAAAIPLIASFLIFGVAVLMNKTDMSRYMALVTPLPLLLVYGAISSEIVTMVDTPLNAIMRGTSFNFVMLLFFALWYFHTSGQRSLPDRQAHLTK